MPGTTVRGGALLLSETDTAVLALREHFPGLRRWAYLDFAGVAIVTGDAVAAAGATLEAFASDGIGAGDEVLEMIEDVRARTAVFTGAGPDEICFVRNTTQGLGFVANGLDLRPGERVVAAAGEFPSSYFPWVSLRERGVRVDVVEPVRRDDGVLSWPLARFAAALEASPPARVMGVSWVQYRNGWRHDLAALGELCHDFGTLLCVDVIQGVGAIPLDLGSLPVDFAAADGHKWLCAPEGLGFLYVARDCIESLRPIEAGWNSVPHRFEWENLDWTPDTTARRFEGGSANSAGIAAFGASLGVLAAVPAEARWDRLSRVAGHLVAALDDAGMDVVSDRSTRHASGIVTFRHPRRSPEELSAVLRDAGVVVAAPRDGGVRVAPHCFSTLEEIDLLASVVARA